MRFARILSLLLLAPQVVTAQAYTETWFAITPALPSVGEDVTLFATVWAQTEIPTGSVEFSDRGIPLASAPLVPVAQGHGQIASGERHTCAIAIDGGVWCWGWGGDRQLGNNSLANSPVPVPVQGVPAPVIQLDSGARHTCALTETRAVWCWGYNASGQLGVGDIIQHFTAVAVTGIAAPVVQIGAGGSTSCAVTQQGEVYCWGANVEGQIGDGTTTQRPSPTLVSTLPGRATAVGVGAAHSCAVLRNTRVWCWGRNIHGQLGDGSTVSSSSAVGVVSGRNAVAVALGESHSCLLRNNGVVRCWGRNQAGQLGDGTTTDRLAPVRAIAAGRDVTDIDVSDTHGCAVRYQGRVRCWGANASGQIGDGTTTSRPAGETARLPSVVWAWAVSTYSGGSCAQGAAGDVQCWGYNAQGNTGDGTTVSPRLLPVGVTGGTITWPRASAYARHVEPGGWPAGLRRIRALFAGTTTLAASHSNRIDHTTLP